ncbi:MAG: hypothetical protein Q4P31_04710 [Andreesenia angusta]|nr:hypothetical protein [Andreesenia angusta]
MRKLKILLMTAIMVIGLAVPAFAQEIDVDLNMYKKGTYPPGVPTHANDAVERAYLDVKDNGSTDLVVITKWFTLWGIDGTMTQMKYKMPNEADEVESNYNDPPHGSNGLIRLPLRDSLVETLYQDNEVALPNSAVRNNVKFLGIHDMGYKEVDTVISLKSE